MPSALIFLLVLSLLVVVHEWGHFIVARLVGIRVDKFSIGFGPVIFGKKVGQTEYVFSLLPLGGFVKLAGESPEDATGAKDEFNSKTLLQKFAVVFAGPLMNAVLAFLLFWMIFMIGQPTMTTRVGKILPDSAAQSAGLREGDRIRSVDGKRVELWDDLLAVLHDNPPATLALEVEREGKVTTVSVSPKIQERKSLFGKTVKAAFLGISPSSEVVHVKKGVFEAMAMAADRLWTMTALIFTSLGLMITGAMPFKESMTGPIGIFFMTEKAAQMGLVYLLYFMGSLSVSLFVLNLLPIPVLDGGHVLFILIEKLKGSPLKEVTKERMTQAGMAALLVLMAFVMFQDVQRFSILENIVNLFSKK